MYECRLVAQKADDLIEKARKEAKLAELCAAEIEGKMHEPKCKWKSKLEKIWWKLKEGLNEIQKGFE